MPKMKKGIKIVLGVLGICVLAFIAAAAIGIWQDNHLPQPTQEEQDAYLERRRERAAKRMAFLESELHEAGIQYVAAALEELVPDGAYEIMLEPRNYYMDAPETEFSVIPGTDAEWRAFFSRVNLAFMVNYWDFGIDPHELCDALMVLQISGTMAGDQYDSTQWIFNAETSELDYYVKPGV